MRLVSKKMTTKTKYFAHTSFTRSTRGKLNAMAAFGNREGDRETTEMKSQSMLN